MTDISSRNFDREKYSRQDFFLANKVRLHVIISGTINNTAFPDSSGLIFANESPAQLLSVSTHCNDQPSVSWFKISNPDKTTKQTFQTFGLSNDRLYSVLKMHGKSENNQTCFSAIIRSNLKNSVRIEWVEIAKELLLQPVRGLELLRPTSNRRTVEDRLILHMQSETKSNDRHFKRNEICSFFGLVQSFVRYFQNRFNFKKF